MSVFLLTSSFVTTVLIPHEEFEEGGEANGRALAYLAHELPRRRLRHRLRRQHDPDPLVRRGLGDGRAAEHRAALPAALRHGPRVGAGGPPAGAGLHRHRLRRHDHLPRRRRRPGRGLRHRRPGADDLGGDRRDPRRLARGQAAARGVVRADRGWSSSTPRPSTSSSGPTASRSPRFFIGGDRRRLARLARLALDRVARDRGGGR